MHNRFRSWLMGGGLVAALVAVAAAQNLRVTGRVTGDGPAYLAGPVGIGTDAPTEKLTVSGRALLTGTGGPAPSERALRALGPEGQVHNLAAVFPQIDSTRIFIGGKSARARTTFVPGVGFRTVHDALEPEPATSGVSLGQVGREALHADLVNRRVGIGTAAPSATLEVAGDIKASGRYAGGLAPAPGRFYDLEMMQAHASGAALAAMKNHRTWWRVARVPTNAPNRTCGDVCGASRRSWDNAHGQCLGRVSIYFNPDWTPVEAGLTTSMENAIVPDNCGGGSIGGSTASRGDWCVCY